MCFGFGLAALLNVGCTSYERCVRKYGRTQPDQRIPVEFKVEQQHQFTSLPLAQIPLLMPGEVHVVESEDSRASIRYWRDKYNEALNIEAQCDTITIRDTLRIPAPVILDPPPPSFASRTWRSWANMSGVVLAAILIYLLFKHTKR